MVMNPITIVSSRFLSSDQLDLKIERKPFSLSQGDFTVTNTDGGVIFDIKQNFFSLFDRRVMFDAAGIPVLSFHKKLWSFLPGWDVFRGDSNEKIFCAKERSPFFPIITSLNVFLGCNTKENVCDFKVKSGWFDESCTIYAGDDTTIVAKMRKKHTFQSIALGKDRYDVMVYPNVDYAFIVALVVILQELNEEKNNDEKKSAK
ncbi:hypothetical protein CTI12_AA075950 [Artemisia annua]|uniref:Tubby C-terminal-like domain-containing protein n=1 Tax=Artemisia annua TaxID=35608 RepID=A0A2U1Q4P6_ARTAN|nr:hypothetical protein CTI12_AA075950 [Artemisia annua]